jgi:hypothetical protein
MLPEGGGGGGGGGGEEYWSKFSQYLHFQRWKAIALDWAVKNALLLIFKPKSRNDQFLHGIYHL